MRGPDEFPRARREEALRISVFGDSYTYGADVDDAEPWPAQLAQAIPESQVLNFGTAGYGHDQIMLNLERNGAAWSPDVVLVGLIDVDRDRNVLDFYNAPKPRFVVDDGRLIATNVPVPTPEQVLAQHDRSSRTVDAMWMLAHVALATGSPHRSRPEVRAVTDALFARLDQSATALDVPVFYVHIPSPSRLGGGDTPEMFEELARLCGGTVHTCVDTAPALASTDADLTGGMTHYNARGYGIIAEVIAGALEEAGLGVRDPEPSQDSD